MKYKRIITLLLLIAIVTIPSSSFLLAAASKYSSLLETREGRGKLAALAQMEESRAIAANVIETLLTDPNALIRIRCAEVLGRIADPMGISYLERLLEDENMEVAETAVYALGLIGSEEVLEPLKNCLSNKPKHIRLRTLQALGITKKSDAVSIIEPSLTDFHSVVRAEAALSIASLGDTTAAVHCLDPLHDPSDKVVTSAVYAIGRLRYRAAGAQIAKLLDHKDRTMRMRVAEALGRIKEEKAIDQFGALLLDEDRMVRIKTAEALARIGEKKSARILEQVLASEDSYIRTIALEGITSSKNKKSFESVVPLLEDRSLMVRIAAIAAAAATGEKKAREHILASYKKGAAVEKMTALGALGRVGVKEDIPLLTSMLLAADDYFLREGAAAGLGAWKEKKELEEPVTIEGETLRPIDALVRCADDDDWVVATMSIESVGRIGRPEVISDLVAVFEKRTSRLDGDRRLEIVRTVSSLGEELNDGEREAHGIVNFLRNASMDSDPRIARAAAASAERFGATIKAQPSGNWKRGEPPWGEPSLPLGERKIVLRTNRGDIEILLYGDDAPNIVHSVLSLAESGFYDGLTFHRVVPGFVIQGGCPRGDGWGDAGYFLRSQFNMHRYERGMVGMAHAGKDTPGSQFFITQTSQPHLDGRYTIIGKVTMGMEVVDLIEVGDTFSIVVLE